MNVAQVRENIEEVVLDYRQAYDAFYSCQQTIQELEKGPLTLKPLISAHDSLKKILVTLEESIDKKQAELAALVREVCRYVWTHPEKENNLGVSVIKDTMYNDDGLKSDTVQYVFSKELGELLNLVFEPFIEDGDIALYVYSDWGRKFSAKEIKELTISGKSSYEEFLKIFNTHLLQTNVI